MTTAETLTLAADFRRRADAAKADGFPAESTTWHLAAALLIEAGGECLADNLIIEHGTAKVIAVPVEPISKIRVPRKARGLRLTR